MEPFDSAFGKKNRTAAFFVWLNSRIERNRFILCLVREPCECRGEEGECSCSRERLHPVIFYGAGAFQLLTVNFHIEIQEPLHSYFVGNQTVGAFLVTKHYNEPLGGTWHL
jgi:hypothetical protein